MAERPPPKEMAKKLTRLLKKQDPDYGYLQKVFGHVRESLGLKGKISREKKLPELLTDEEMKRFCAAVREANHRVHTVMIKLLIYTGVRSSSSMMSMSKGSGSGSIRGRARKTATSPSPLASRENWLSTSWARELVGPAISSRLTGETNSPLVGSERSSGDTARRPKSRNGSILTCFVIIF